MSPDLQSAERALGSAVRALRISRELTREEVARRANVSLGAVRNLETGSGSTIATLVQVVHALDADGWLTALTPAPPPFSPLAVLEQVNRERKVRQRVRPRRGAGGS
jgi:transcriptional regulator with XRE-family HTH domain